MSPSLSDDADAAIADIAERHGFKPDAAEALVDALRRSGGSMAQFNHPDLGGMGQWSRGGMMMIGEMNNDRLKARVGDLARDLLDAIQEGRIGGNAEDKAGRSTSSTSSQSSSGGSWWPKHLGTPSSTGSQNASRYAVFPDRKRLVIEEGGRVSVYDTGDQRIEGAAQQQSGEGSMRFSTRSGSVRIEDLNQVDEGTGEDDVRAKRQAGPASPVGTHPVPGDDHAAPPSARSGGDPIDTLRRLAGLRDEGILTEAEFSEKKQELLARL